MSLVRINKQTHALISDTSGNTVGISGSSIKASITDLPNVTIANSLTTTHTKTYSYSSQALSMSNNTSTTFIDVSDSTIINLFTKPTNGSAFTTPITLRLQVSDTSSFTNAIDTMTEAVYINSSADIVDMRITDLAAPYIRLKAEGVFGAETLLGTLHIFKYY